MAKFLQRMSTKKEKFLISMKIISVEIPVKEKVTRMSIEWKRGDKKSETKQMFELTPEKPVAFVNEVFSKESMFYRLPKTGKYQQKQALIRVKGFTTTEGQPKEKIFGELEMDISAYVGAQNEIKSLLLNKALPNSVINLQLTVGMPGEEDLQVESSDSLEVEGEQRTRSNAEEEQKERKMSYY